MMQPMSMSHVMVGQITRLATSLWLRWVLANAVGMALVATSVKLFPSRLPSIVSGSEWMALLTVAVLVTIPQCLILRQHVRAMGWWALATVGGIFLGIVLSLAFIGIIAVMGGAGLFRVDLFQADLAWIALMLSLILAPVVTGAGSGALQALVLRSSIGRSGWWIPASILGSLLALPATWGSVGTREPIAAILSGAVAGAVYGIVTGLALERLLHRR